MATYGGGIRFAGAVAASNSVNRTTSGGTSEVTVYTCPANRFAIVTLNYYCNANTLSFVTSAQGTILIGNVNVAFAFASNTTGSSASNGSVQTPNTVGGVYIGPGQSVVVRAFLGGNASGISANAFASISGVEFTN